MAVSVSVWASSIVASWFTPSPLFILLNLTIGTIFLMTRFGNRKATEHHHDYSHQLARAPSSLLDRVKSFNFSLYKFEPPSAAHTELHHHQECDHLTEYPNQIVRTPSLIDRLKSIKLYRSEPEMVHPDPSLEVYGQGHVAEYPNHPDNSTQLVRTPSLLERLKSIKLYRSEPEIIHPDPSPEVHDGGHPDNPRQLVRNPSLLERLKCIKLYKSEQPDPNPETGTMTPEFNDHGVKRSKSESESKVKRREENMTKSASEKSAAAAREDEEDGGEEEIAVVERRRPAMTRVEKSSRGMDQTVLSGEDDGVDAKADDFINRFKQQLKLQRLESLRRLRETWKGK